MVGWLNPLDLTSGAQSLQTQEQISAQQKVAQAMLERARKPRQMTHWTQALAQGMEGAMAGLAAREAANAGTANAAWNAQALTGDLSAPGTAAATPTPSASGGSVPSMAGGASVAKVMPEIKDGIVQTASALGIAPVDLATAISYETGGTFDPTKAGPTTKWGQHRGLIQFGEPQAKQHGVDWSNPVGSQLGPNGAVASYLRSAGVKPGMGLLDIYSAINAGAPGLYDRSDAAAGGAPGTVRDKVEKQMAGHRAKAQALFGAADMPAPGARNVEMPGNGDGFVIPGPYREGQPVAEPLQAPVDRGTNLAPQEALQPLAQPASAPMDGQTFNAITADAPLEPVFKSEGVSQPWMGTALPAQAAPAPAALAAVAQAAPTPMPPARPANLAMPSPQADMPAPGAKPAMLQLPVSPATGMPDLSNENGAGARELMVAEALARQGQPSPFAQAAPAAQPMPQAAFASAPMATPPQAAPTAVAAPVAPASPVERVAAAMPAQAAPAAAAAAPAAPASTGAQGVAAALGVNPRVLAAATSPYASEGTRKIAQTIIQKQMEDAKYNAPDAVAGRRLEIEGKGLSNEKTRRELMGEGATPLTAEERTAYGIGPNQSAYKTRNGEIKFGPAGTTINNNMDMKAEGAEASERGKGLGKRLNEIADEGAKAGEDTVLFQRLGDILSTVKTGKSTETLEKIRQATGIALDPNTDNVQALNALIQYIGPRLRVPGSGAQSDRELSNFLNSIVSLAGTPEGNQKILETLNGFVEHKRQRSAIASEWQLGEISAKDAQKRIDSLPSPFAKREDSKPAAPAAAVPDRSALEAEARRRGLIK